jgi:Asp-tRNA(Asn)/Glu-tRNA(Gln) amidotransferase A subunit family amidase
VPLGGILPFAPSLDHPGPMARTIADCSALLTAMAAGDPATNPLTPPPAQLGGLPTRARPGPRPLEGLTVAVTDRVSAVVLEDGVATGFEAAQEACQSLGARLVSLPAPWTLDWDDLSLVLLTEAWFYHARFAGRRALYRPALAEFLEAASGFTDAQAYLGAQQRRGVGTAAWDNWFRSHGVDLVLEPTLPILPVARGVGYDRGHAGGPGDPFIALTALWDMTGMPVASLPVTWNVGVSLVAPRGGEAALVQAAIDLQEHALGVPVWSGAGLELAWGDRTPEA